MTSKKDNLNILYIWDADYPWDVRVEKICTSLKGAGYKVHIASRNLKKKPVNENCSGIHVHRIGPWRNDLLNYFFSFPLFFSPIWKRFLDKIITKEKIDLIIVRDLPLAIAGIWAGRRFNIPVVFDMAEDYVSMVNDIWKVRKFHGFNLIVRNPYLAKLVEKYAFKNADQIIVVIDEAVDVVTRGGGDNERITIVSNTPSLEIFKEGALKEKEDLLAEIEYHFSVIYTGGIQMGRGLQTVIDAIPKIVEAIPNFKFIVIGDGYAAKKLKEIAAKNKVEKYIEWAGWVAHDQLPKYLRSSNVGIIPHLTSEHVNTTIPNKIFDYMGFGLPVIASDAIPMQRIIKEEKCGRCFKSADAADLAKVVIEVHNDDSDYAANGRTAVYDKYNWSRDEKRLLDVVKRLLK